MSIKTEPYYFAVVDEDGELIDGTISRWERKARWHAMPFSGAYDWEQCVKLGMRVVKVVVSEYEPANNEAVRIAELEAKLAERSGAAAFNLAVLKQWRARAEAANDLLREAREALEPFAPSDEAMAEALWRGLSGMAAGSVAVKLYDFSRASALLTKINEALK